MKYLFFVSELLDSRSVSGREGMREMRSTTDFFFLTSYIFTLRHSLFLLIERSHWCRRRTALGQSEISSRKTGENRLFAIQIKQNSRRNKLKMQKIPHKEFYKSVLHYISNLPIDSGISKKRILTVIDWLVRFQRNSWLFVLKITFHSRRAKSDLFITRSFAHSYTFIPSW